MKKIITGAILASAIAATPAFAQDADKGPYVQLRTGVATLNNPEFRFIDTYEDNQLETRMNAKSAWAVGGEVGYDLGNIRVGLDLSYQRNKVNGITLRSLNGTAITDANAEALFTGFNVGCGDSCTAEDLEGVEREFNEGIALDGARLHRTNGSIARLRQVAVMANIAYDIPVGDTFKPYVGVGLGAVGTHVDVANEDDGSLRFAWQVRAGAAVKLTQGVDLTADYTYRQTSAGKLSLGDDEDMQYRLGKTKASLFMVGLRFTL